MLMFLHKKSVSVLRLCVGMGIVGMSLSATAQPLIRLNPLDLFNVPVGSSVSFEVDATGSNPLSYQWRLNGVKIPDATNSFLGLTNVSATNGGLYQVVVVDPSGVTISEPAFLTLNLPDLGLRDNFSSLLELPNPAPSGVGRGSNLNATRELGEPKHGKKGTNSVWFKWLAVSNGVATFRTAGSTFETLLAAYEGNAVDASQLVDRDVYDDDEGGFHTSLITFNVAAGTTYHVAIDGAGGQSGEVVLSWNLDNSAADIPRLTEVPTSKTLFDGTPLDMIVGFTAPGPVEQEWLFNGSLTGNRNRVMNFTSIRPQNVGKYTLRFRSATGKISSTLPIDLQISDDPYSVDPRNIQALDKFFEIRDIAEASRTNRLQRASMGRDRVPVSTPATGYRGTQIFNTYGATKDPQEPVHCNVLGGASEWFAYYATNNGTLHINTDGSNFDTVVAVYTDPSFLGTYESLVEMACDNNNGADQRDSAVRFSAASGTLYYIAIDGVNSSSGIAYLNYNLGEPPTITAHPASQTVNAGSPVSFQVNAVGSTNLSYYWFYNGALLVHETTGMLDFSSHITNAGTYQVVVSNYVDTATSAAVTLTVTSPPVIQTEPADQAVMVTSNANFSVTAVGTGVLSFQWFLNQQSLAGKTNSFLTLTNLSEGQTGNVQVVISNAYGTATSRLAQLTVLSPPFLITPPASITVIEGQTATISVTAGGTAPLRYQWRKNTGIGGAISGATNEFFSVPNITLSQAGRFRVDVTNAYGSVSSSFVDITVNAPPFITTQPFSRTFAPGTNATLSVSATGNPAVVYQWTHAGTNIPGANGSDLNLAGFNSSHEGLYQVHLSNSLGQAVSLPAELYLDSPLRIINFRRAANTTAFTAIGVAGGSLQLYSSREALTNWSLLLSTNSSNGILPFSEPTNDSEKFYQVR